MFWIKWMSKISLAFEILSDVKINFKKPIFRPVWFPLWVIMAHWCNSAKSVRVPRHIDFHFPDFTASQKKLVKMSVLKTSVQLGKYLRKTAIKFWFKRWEVKVSEINSINKSFSLIKRKQLTHHFLTGFSSIHEAFGDSTWCQKLIPWKKEKTWITKHGETETRLKPVSQWCTVISIVITSP